MIITIANQKGGVGKSTTTINLACGLAHAGLKTLVVDLDPQANTTLALNPAEEPALSVYHVLVEDYSVADVILTTDLVDLVPANTSLADADYELISNPTLGGQTKLQARLNQVAAGYDYVIIDTPPSLGLLTVSAMLAADRIIVPINPGIFAISGTQKLIDTVEAINSNFPSAAVEILGFLVTFKDATNVAKDVESLLRENFGVLVFDTVIPRNIKIEEAHSRRIDIYRYAPMASGAEAYALFTKEVLDRVK